MPADLFSHWLNRNPFLPGRETKPWTKLRKTFLQLHWKSWNTLRVSWYNPWSWRNKKWFFYRVFTGFWEGFYPSPRDPLPKLFFISQTFTLSYNGETFRFFQWQIDWNTKSHILYLNFPCHWKRATRRRQRARWYLSVSSTSPLLDIPCSVNEY